jgi:hypothetical protein
MLPTGEGLGVIAISGLFEVSLAGVVIDLSALRTAIVVTTDAKTVTVGCEAHSTSEHMPCFRPDVSGGPGDDAFVVFTGRSWIGQFHNLMDKIVIDHGQLNIHLSAELEGWQPPHVSLDGVGAFHINGVKQLSAFSPGKHEDNIIGEETSMEGFVWTYAMIRTVVVIRIGIDIFFHPRSLWSRMCQRHMWEN